MSSGREASTVDVSFFRAVWLSSTSDSHTDRPIWWSNRRLLGCRPYRARHFSHSRNAVRIRRTPASLPLSSHPRVSGQRISARLTSVSRRSASVSASAESSGLQALAGTSARERVLSRRSEAVERPASLCRYPRTAALLIAGDRPASCARDSTDAGLGQARKRRPVSSELHQRLVWMSDGSTDQALR